MSIDGLDKDFIANSFCVCRETNLSGDVDEAFQSSIEDGVCPNMLMLFNYTGHTSASALANLRFIAGFFLYV
jgi:hypothetical protein